VNVCKRELEITFIVLIYEKLLLFYNDRKKLGMMVLGLRGSTING
jgi:hypothetical protein